MYISIEGNIGSGKSTLAKELAKQLNAIYLPEKFEKNVLLPLFYSDRKKYAFPTEYSFLIERHKQLTTFFKSKRKTSITVSDFHFDKSICFAKANLSKEDYSYFKKHFKAIKNSIEEPNLIVYIDSKVPLLIENIKKRGREMEKGIEIDYLILLKKIFDKYYLIKDKIGTKIFVLTIDNYNEMTLNMCCKKIIEELNFCK